MDNPLLMAQELPAFSAVRPEHVTPAIEQLIAENQAAIAALKQSQSTNFGDMVNQLDELEDRLNKAWSPVSHMNSVVNNDELREVYNQCLSLLFYKPSKKKEVSFYRNNNYQTKQRINHTYFQKQSLKRFI